MISRGREWDWMDEKIKVMSEEEAKNALIEVLMNQVIDLSMMSKIELGDDVIKEIKRLQEIINQNKDE
jgi:ferredoxin-fold anticodon binding domain-containing protein